MAATLAATHPDLFAAVPDEAARPPGLLRLAALLATVPEVRAFHADRGIPDADMLAALLTPYHSRNTYLCGRDEFMAACKEAAKVIGTPREQVHQEIYASLTGDAFADIVPHEVEVTADSPQVTVHNLGATFTVPWPAGESLVDVLINNGHDVPYSYQSGECATCLCKLTKGTVEMAVTDGLDPDDAEDGYILGCQAKPTSPELEVEY